MKSILLTLLDADDLNRSELDSAFRTVGFTPQVLTPGGATTPATAPRALAAVLIIGQFERVRLDKAVRELSKHFGGDGGAPPLIACGYRLPASDERKLRALGVNKVVEPAEWKAQAVAERVLAALLGGFITKRDGVKTETHIACGAGEQPFLLCRVPYEAKMQVRKIMGGTQRMLALFRDIKAYARTPYPVLIRGATGTGKELVAAAIHSPGAAESGKKFIPINIAETPTDLVAAELFGHAKGAFTGADRSRRGLLVEADDGTVFMDEIGDLDKANQTRLLRVFENREIRVVGEEREKVLPLKARLIFATNRQLEQMCFEGNFRHDLFHRIREGHRVELPSLGERKGDLELLAKEIFAGWYEERKGYHEDIFTLEQGDFDKIVDLCIGHEFRGNVRGLRSVLRGCFNDSLLLDGFFNLEQLKAELDADRKVAEVSDRSDSSGGASQSQFIKIDLTESYAQFKARAHAEYFTAIYKSVGRSLGRAAEITGVVKSTVWKNLSPEERRRHPRGEELQLDPDGDKETSGEP